jgi:hypothetical protein
MYSEQSPSLADYFEARTGSLFVSDSLQSWVEVCAFRPRLKSSNGATGFEKQSIGSGPGELVKTRQKIANTGNHSDSVSPATEAMFDYGLPVRKVSRAEDLKRFIMVRRL